MGLFDTIRYSKEKQIRPTYPADTNLYYSLVDSILLVIGLMSIERFLMK